MTGAVDLARARGHPSTGPVRLPYMPGLDGLRALAVLSVLLYHGQVSWARGGFLGVEVFFVISGYLITALLLRERGARGYIGLRNFYERRARRLLPALFAVLVAACLVAVVFLPDEVASLRGDVVASLTYSTNWFFVVSEKSYFEFVGRPSLVQHLWSLAVEEQFYLLWPLIFALGMRLLGKVRMLVAVLLGAAGSTWLMIALHEPGADPSRVYYGTDTRATALLLGSALALVWSPWRLRPRAGRGAPILLDIVGAMALALLVHLLLVTDEFSAALYEGGFLRLSVVSAVVIGVAAHPAAHFGRVLGVAPLRWIGLRSYGIYLWHWPVFQLTRPQLDLDFSGAPLLALRFAITFAIAEVSYRFLERPIRHGAIGRRLAEVRSMGADARRLVVRRWVDLGALAAVAVALLAFTVGRAEMPPPPDYLVFASGSPVSGSPPVGGGQWDGAPWPTTTTRGAAAPASAPGGADPGEAGGPSDTGGLPAGAGGTAASGGSGGEAPAVTLPIEGASLAVSAGPLALTAAATTVPPAPAASAPEVPPATEPPPPPPTLRISAIGDSVMLGAAPALHAGLPGAVFVDAAVGRQVSTGIEMLRSWRDNGFLGDVVVVHLGNNGTFSPEQFEEMAAILAGVPKVVFLTVKVPRLWEESVNQVLWSGVPRMPNAVLVDWRGSSMEHPEYFWDDGMHLRPEGAAAYTQLVASQL